MVLTDYNVELDQQPGATPFWNIPDLTIWQAIQLEVDRLNREDRHREPELVKVCKRAWAATPDVKILQAFEMRKDCAQEALETDGWCPNEGKGAAAPSAPTRTRPLRVAPQEAQNFRFLSFGCLFWSSVTADHDKTTKATAYHRDPHVLGLPTNYFGAQSKSIWGTYARVYLKHPILSEQRGSQKLQGLLAV